MGYGVMGVLSWQCLLKLTVSGYTQIFSSESMCQTSKSFKGARTCSRSSITGPSLVWLRFNPPLGRPKTLSFFCLFVCPTRFWTSKFVSPISPWWHWSTETILMPFDRERFVVVHMSSTFSDSCQLAIPLNAEVQKTAKIGGFRQQRATK